MTHCFRYVFFSFNSKTVFFISLFLPWLNLLGAGCLVYVSSWAYCRFCCCCPLLTSASQRGCGCCFSFLCLGSLALFTNTWSLLEKVLSSAENKVYSSALGGMFCKCLFSPFNLWCDLTAPFLCLVFVWIPCPLEKVGYWNHYHCVRVNMWSSM